MSARVVGTHIWPPASERPIPVDPLELDWGGPIGDRHHGLTMAADVRQADVFDRGTEIRNHRQVSIVDTSELDEIARNLGIDRIEPGLIADNICTEGITHLTRLPRMSRLVFPSGAVLMLGGENLPCTIAGAMVAEVHGSRAESFPKAGMGLRGVTGWVERPGAIRTGDAVEVVLP